jgi:hypothetical protein
LDTPSKAPAAHARCFELEVGGIGGTTVFFGGDIFLIFLKNVLGGILAVVVAWTLIVWAYLWRLNVITKREGSTGLMAVAGGWTYLLHHRPLVMILLTAAFGAGLYLATHWASS